MRRGFWVSAAGFVFLSATTSIIYSVVSPIVIQEKEDFHIPVEDECFPENGAYFVESHFFNLALLDGNFHCDRTKASMMGTLTRYGGMPKINRSMPCFSRMRRIGGVTMPMVWWESAKDETIATYSRHFVVESTHGVVVPLWPVAVGSLVIAIVLAVRAGWFRRRLMSGCLNCHYDLRGNESGVCPECGTEIPQRAAIPEE